MTTGEPRRPDRGRAWQGRGGAARGWGSTFGVVLSLAVLACGGARRVELSFANSGDNTFWVAVALLDAPDGLDGYTTQQIIDQKDALEGLSSVVDAVVLKVRPDTPSDPREMSMESFLSKQGWIVAVALLANDTECARKRIMVDTGRQLTFSVRLSNDCLDLILID